MFAARRSSPRRTGPSAWAAPAAWAACLALLGGTAPAQDMLPRPNALRAAGLELAWWEVGSVPRGRDRVEHLSADEDAVYVQTAGNLLTAIDLTTGAKKWTTRVGREGQNGIPVGTSPAVAAGPDTPAVPPMVLACVARTCYALHKDTGETLWALPLPHAAAAPPTVGSTDEGRRLFVATTAGMIYSYDLETVEEFDLEKRLEEFATGTLRWRFEAGSPPSGRVGLSGITAVFGNEDGSLFGIDAEERELLWRFDTDGGASAPAVVSGGTAYLPTEDRTVYAVDVENGLDRWAFTSQEPVRAPPAVVGGAVYLTPDRVGVSRVDRDTGRQLWRADRTNGFLAEAGGRAYVSDFADDVVALDLATGRPVGLVRLNRYPIRVQNVLTDRLIVANREGVVLCLKAAGAGFPIYYANPDRRPVEPVFAGDAPADPAPAADDPAAADAD